MNLLAILLLAPAGDLLTLPSHECLDADFVQVRRIESLSQPLEMRGRLHVESGRRLSWEVLEPFPYTYRLSGNEIEEVMPDGTVRRLDLDQAPWLAAIGRLMQAALAGDLDSLSEYFDIRNMESDDVETRIRLVPQDVTLSGQIEALELVWTDWPQRLRIFSPGGDVTTIRFHKVTPCAVPGEDG